MEITRLGDEWPAVDIVQIPPTENKKNHTDDCQGHRLAPLDVTSGANSRHRENKRLFEQNEAGPFAAIHMPDQEEEGEGFGRRGMARGQEMGADDGMDIDGEATFGFASRVNGEEHGGGERRSAADGILALALAASRIEEWAGRVSEKPSSPSRASEGFMTGGGENNKSDPPRPFRPQIGTSLRSHGQYNLTTTTTGTQLSPPTPAENLTTLDSHPSGTSTITTGLVVQQHPHRHSSAVPLPTAGPASAVPWSTSTSLEYHRTAPALPTLPQYPPSRFCDASDSTTLRARHATIDHTKPSLDQPSPNTALVYTSTKPLTLEQKSRESESGQVPTSAPALANRQHVIGGPCVREQNDSKATLTFLYLNPSDIPQESAASVAVPPGESRRGARRDIGTPVILPLAPEPTPKSNPILAVSVTSLSLPTPTPRPTSTEILTSGESRGGTTTANPHIHTGLTPSQPVPAHYSGAHSFDAKENQGHSTLQRVLATYFTQYDSASIRSGGAGARKVNILDPILASHNLLHTHAAAPTHTRRPSQGTDLTSASATVSRAASFQLGSEQYNSTTGSQLDPRPRSSLSGTLLSGKSFDGGTKVAPPASLSSLSSTSATRRQPPHALSILSPSTRREPYPSPSPLPLGSARSVPLFTPSLLKSSRPKGIGSMASPSISHSPSTTPVLPPNTPPQQRAASARLGSPSPSMSFSKRRRAPEWPSPRHQRRSSHTQLSDLASADTPQDEAMIVVPASSRKAEVSTPSLMGDLGQTLQTPGILKVPPTPLHSPAFWRQGLAQPHPSASLQQHRLNPSGPVPIHSNGHAPRCPGQAHMNGYQRPASPRHPPYASAPPLSAPRLENPAFPAGSASGSGKRDRVNLMNVPKGWVIEQLNKRAGQYWHDPASSDVRILVPIPRSQAHSAPSTDLPSSATSAHSNQPHPSRWPTTPPHANISLAGTPETHPGLLEHVTPGRSAGAFSGPNMARRGSLPGSDDIVVLVFPLHQDYLLTQSTLFRALLTSSAAHLDPHRTRPVYAPATSADQHAGATPADGGDATMASPVDTPTTTPYPSPPRNIRGARLLPTLPGDPLAIYLPLPDPASFSVIVHWLYWGNTDALESALNRGMVQWQGVVRNVHYLGLDDGVKRVLGKWWRRWVKTDEGRARGGAGAGRSKSASKTGAGMGGKESGWESEDEDKESERDGKDRETSPEPVGKAVGTGVTGVEVDDGGVSGLMRAL